MMSASTKLGDQSRAHTPTKRRVGSALVSEPEEQTDDAIKKMKLAENAAKGKCLLASNLDLVDHPGINSKAVQDEVVKTHEEPAQICFKTVSGKMIETNETSLRFAESLLKGPLCGPDQVSLQPPHHFPLGHGLDSSALEVIVFAPGGRSGCNELEHSNAAKGLECLLATQPHAERMHVVC